MRPRTCPWFQATVGPATTAFIYAGRHRRKSVKAKGPEQKGSILGLALKGNRGNDVKLHLGDQLHVWFMMTKVADAHTVVELGMVQQHPLFY